MGMLKARVLVMTVPDMNLFYVQRGRNVGQHVYAFHAVASAHLQYRRHAFGTERPVSFPDIPFRVDNPACSETGIEAMELALRWQAPAYCGEGAGSTVVTMCERLLGKTPAYVLRMIREPRRSGFVESPCMVLIRVVPSAASPLVRL